MGVYPGVCHFPTAEDLLRVVFPRRDLLKIPVITNPRAENHVFIGNKEFLGSHRLSKVHMSEFFMSAASLGLDQYAESWWVVSHGRWCPCYYYYYYYSIYLPIAIA